MLRNIFWIAIGGGMGASARYLIGIWAHLRWGSDVPWGTWIVNLLGSFLIGLLASWFVGIEDADRLRLLFITGFLGAFTTFSTFSMETVSLLQKNETGLALLNIFGSVVLGIAFCILGIYAGKQLA